MDNCARCSTPISGPFCGQCGLKHAKPQPSEVKTAKFCESCGTETTPDSKFCPGN